MALITLTPAAGPVRLTTRGRMVAGALAVAAGTLAAFALMLVAGGGALAANHGGPPRAGYQGMRQVVVQPGQTLWSIAVTAEPWQDPRKVIPEIRSANSLAGAAIYPGQRLWVPR